MAQAGERRFIVSTGYGGTGGNTWDDGFYDGVREITLRVSTHIDSIAVGYYKNGENINADKHGGQGGNPIVITLGTNEFITNVSGYVDAEQWATDSVIQSLKFQTNIGEYGPYGQKKGIPFTVTVNPEDTIIGFFGRSDLYLDAIGVHVAQGIAHP